MNLRGSVGLVGGVQLQVETVKWSQVLPTAVLLAECVCVCVL